MRWVVSAVGVQNNGNFRDPLMVQTGLDHHLAGKLHSRSLQMQPLVGFPAEAAETAVGIADRSMKEQVQDPSEDWVADVAMQPGHGPRPDAALKAIAHDQIVASAKLIKERFDVAKVVRIIGIAHDHVTATCGGDAALEGIAVATTLDVN